MVAWSLVERLLFLLRERNNRSVNHCADGSTCLDRASHHRHDGDVDGGEHVQDREDEVDLDRSLPLWVFPAEPGEAEHGKADAHLKDRVTVSFLGRVYIENKNKHAIDLRWTMVSRKKEELWRREWDGCKGMMMDFYGKYLRKETTSTKALIL